jgi:hypothetical protein
MNPLAWLKPGRWLLYLGLAGALVLGYYAWRDYQRELGYQQAVDKLKAQADAADAKREVITQVVERRVVQRVKDIQIITETIYKEVPVYVRPTDPPLSAGFRVLHDAAARGEVPGPAAIADAAAVPAQDAARTVTENYGACRADRARLIELQGWARAQQAAQ